MRPAQALRSPPRDRCSQQALWPETQPPTSCRYQLSAAARPLISVAARPPIWRSSWLTAVWFGLKARSMGTCSRLRSARPERSTADETTDASPTHRCGAGFPLHQVNGYEKGLDGLQGMVREFLGQNPLAGHFFLSLNRRRDRITLLWLDRDGLVIW
jgi:IS66 Orf2 like protein